MQRNKGMMHGRRFYGRLCDEHHRTGNLGARHIIGRMQNKRCEKCGWDKAYCDRHRLDHKLGYVEGNVIILCPNCHRLAEIAKKRA